VDDPDEVKLYKKKNTLLFMALQEAIETNEGLTIIKRHSKKMDGVAVWNDLSNHYDSDIAAITRTKYLFGLICSSKIPANHKGLAAAIDSFRRWVIEHNYFCKTNENISEDQELIYFERYIGGIKELTACKKIMDVQEDTAVGSQVVVRSSSAKIDFYYRQAQELDAEFKTTVINARRKINASMIHGGFVADESQLWDMDVYSAGINANSVTLESDAFDAVDAIDEAYRYINVGEARRHGQMPKENWHKLTREYKKHWLKFSVDARENILTSLLPSPPPSNSEEHRIPGTGVSSRNARATNAAESDAVPEDTNTNERSVNMGYIQAMRARSTAAHEEQDTKSHFKRDPFVPARLMSRQNKSPNQLIPIKRGEHNQQTNASVATTLQSAGFPDLLPNSYMENRRVNMAFTVRISNLDRIEKTVSTEDPSLYRALVDGGANAGLANPKYLKRLWYAEPPRFINVTGIVGNKICALKIASFAAKVTTSEGTQVILVFHEYGEIVDGPTIHSKIQMACAGCEVGDLPQEMGGTQSITTSTRDGSITIPITFKDGLSFVDMTYPTDDDLKDLAWIEMTHSTPWDPSIFDGKRSFIVKGNVPKLVLRSCNETVVLAIRTRKETICTDTVYTDVKCWEARNYGEAWGEINEID